jgi:hypothetical protein
VSAPPIKRTIANVFPNATSMIGDTAVAATQHRAACDPAQQRATERYQRLAVHAIIA